MSNIGLFLTLSTVCNYRCVFCANPTMEGKQHLPFDAIAGFLGDSLSSESMCIEYVDITGYGEITAHPEFTRIIEYFTDHCVPIRMVTNGSLLDAEKRALLARSSLQEIVFSLNSLDRTSYAKLMGRDKLPTVLENIDALCSLLESRPQRATVIFSFVTLGANWGEVFDFVDFGARYGRPVSLLGLTPTLAHIYTEDMIVEDTPQNRATLENVRRYAASEAVELSAFHFETQNNVVDQDRSKAALDISDCDWVYTKCFVGIDGELTPCCWSQHGLGSIHGHTLAELWDGEGYRELRALISANDPLYCMNCRKDG